MGKFNENRERIITQDKFIRRMAGNEGKFLMLKLKSGLKR